MAVKTAITDLNILRLWNSRTAGEHYEIKQWSTRNSYAPRAKNIQHIGHVLSENLDKALLPPLYVKLGLMKNFAKATAKQNSNSLEFICEKFPMPNQVKSKEGFLLVHRFGKFLKTKSLKTNICREDCELLIHFNGFNLMFREI